MRRISITLATAAASGALLLGMAGPAGAAGEPNGSSSCLAKIFQAQAVSGPQVVSDRILEIREYWLDGGQFGQALKPMATGSADYC